MPDRKPLTQHGFLERPVTRDLSEISADVAILVMDASELATGQDTHIANYILEAYKGIVLALNKWDLASEAGLKSRSIY
ncbi:MAG: hypothetical protein IH827_04430 [Myxococcales bacterium]|nr:hypothetical protein [Myxococcales bacterium]